MYRRNRSNPLTGILFTIILGMVFGAGYLLLTETRSARETLPVTVSPPASAVAGPRFIEATPEPLAATAESLARPLVETVPHEITSGAVFFAPTAGIHAPIVQAYLNGQSWDIGDLGTNAGHLQGTSWMNTVGNIVLAGHVEMNDGRRGIFATLPDVSQGDPLFLTQGDRRFVYSVSEVLSVAPDELSVVYPSDRDILTLITCSDYDFLNDQYETRIVVRAERIS